MSVTAVLDVSASAFSWLQTVLAGCDVTDVTLTHQVSSPHTGATLASGAWTFAKCNARDAPYLSRSASHTFIRVGSTIYGHFSPIWVYAGWFVCLRVCRRAHEVLLGVLLLSPGVYSMCVLVARCLIIQYHQEYVLFFFFFCAFACLRA